MQNDIIQRLADEVASKSWKQTEESLEEKIKKVVQLSQGNDRIIEHIRPSDDFDCALFPNGTLTFLVYSYHMIRIEQCFHVDSVFIYRERMVVLSTRDIWEGKLPLVPRLLLEDFNAQ